jgi:hypothetical protein
MTKLACGDINHRPRLWEGFPCVETTSSTDGIILRKGCNNASPVVFNILDYADAVTITPLQVGNIDRISTKLILVVSKLKFQAFWRVSYSKLKGFL